MFTRITTKAMISNYSRNLNRSISNLNSAREKVITKRNFNKMAEDPGAATKAFQLRREYMQNETYIDNIQTVQATYTALEESNQQINKVLQNINSEVLSAINGSSSVEARESYVKSLEESMQAVVLSINSTFNGKFVFGGKNTSEVPFELTDSGQLLYYAGVDDSGNPIKLDVNSSDPDVQKQLQQLANEHNFMDIGIGLKTSADGKSIMKDSAIDTALSGLQVLGFGSTDSGVSKNVVTLMGQIADRLKDPDFKADESFQKLTDQFKENMDGVVDTLTQLGVKSAYLETTKTRLGDNGDALAEKIVSLENIDMAEAITNYSWEQYSYNAALKVGTSILSQSFIDFMR